MNNKTTIPTLVLLMAFSLAAPGADIYKSVGEDGVTEFSDRPSSNADKIEVNPNVVQTNPVRARAPAASKADAAPAAEPVPAEAQNRERREQKVTAARATSRKARAEDAERARRANQELRRTSDPVNRDLAIDPNPGRALRNEARNAP